ncbi:MAG: hypothetical protein V2A54_02770 [Bacteroidota bacterium]
MQVIHIHKHEGICKPSALLAGSAGNRQLIIKKEYWHQPLLDTTELHALVAVEFVLS